MATLYKLTDQNMQTHNGFQWILNEKKTASGEGDLCGPGWIHAYTDPLLAVFLNPIHANIDNPRLFECNGIVGKTDHGLKVGCAELTLIKELQLPEITTGQRVEFAILCARQVHKDAKWNTWADNWLSGKDRTLAAAEAAEAWAEAAAARAAARAATWAAAAAMASARAATWAEAAAEAAAMAATWAADIDLITIAREAIR